MLPTFRPYILLMTALLLFVGAAPVKSQKPAAPAERIAFAGYRYGHWDIYSIAPDGSSPRQVTNDAYEDTDPAYSPDGAKLAFASRRENNWDVYVLDLLTGQETRVTSSPEYDGAPTWSPDGRSLAYESHQAGNLDIWRVNLDELEESGPANLTSESPAGDFGPAWSPDGQTIAFTSWREGTRDIWLLDLDRGTAGRLTGAATAEAWPAWHPGGEQVAFVIDDLGDREIFTLDLFSSSEQGGPVQPLTWLGRTDGVVWSPDGDRVAAVFHRWNGEVLVIQRPGAGHDLPLELTEPIVIQGRLTWHERAVNAGQLVSALVDPDGSFLYEERVTLNEDPEGEPYNLIRMNDVKTGTPWLADTVDDSFQAWRSRMRNELGYDFLKELSDALRDVAQFSDTSQYASWHKSGRAVDTLFDYHYNGELFHEIVRENYSGETYWRVYLRCLDQSGRCGRPVTANPWNYSQRARTVLAPEQGGVEKANLSGYYLDMTALAREYGWDRISSYDDEDFGWTWHFLAFEYWHYQKRYLSESGGANGSSVNWYRAMSDVYPRATIEKYFNWDRMRAVGDDPHLIALKGAPLPLEFKPWWALLRR